MLVRLRTVAAQVLFCACLPHASLAETALQADHFSCLATSSLTSKMSPPELYRRLPACIRAMNYETAVLVFGLAGAYSRFDLLRVADKSAHQSTSIIRVKAMRAVTQRRRVEFEGYLADVLRTPERRKKLCETVKLVGMPQYHPAYMIPLGLNAVKMNATGLMDGFRADQAWAETLSQYLRCR